MEDSDNLQDSKEVKTNKKSSLGKTITKTALVIGTASIISYSLMKDKILGNPRSKIRKGLFYATLAGIILYKCQGDKVAKVYNSAKIGVESAYGRFYELKKNSDEELNSLRVGYDSLIRKESELEDRIAGFEDYEEKDSLLEINIKKNNALLAEIDSLNYLAKINAAEKDSLSKLVKKYSYLNKKVVSSSAVSSADKKEGKEAQNNVQRENTAMQTEVQVSNSQKNETPKFSYLKPFKFSLKTDKTGRYYYGGGNESFSKDDPVWAIFPKGYTIDEIAEKYYKDISFAGLVVNYNYWRVSIPDRRVYPGAPIILDEGALVNSANLYKGKVPRYSLFETDISFECGVGYVYAEESKRFNVSEALRLYNSLYGLNVYEEQKEAKESGSKYYAVLIPDFLKAWAAVAVKKEDRNGK